MKTAVSRSILLLALGLALAGCMTDKELAERNADRCAARGFKPNTDAFSDCIVQLENERDARREANRREMLEKPATPYIPTQSNR